MATYIFKKLKDPNNHFDNTTVTIEVDAVKLSDLLEAFEEFVKACGFFPEGTLDFQEED